MNSPPTARITTPLRGNITPQWRDLGRGMSFLSFYATIHPPRTRMSLAGVSCWTSLGRRGRDSHATCLAGLKISPDCIARAFPAPLHPQESISAPRCGGLNRDPHPMARSRWIPATTKAARPLVTFLLQPSLPPTSRVTPAPCTAHPTDPSSPSGLPTPTPAHLSPQGDPCPKPDATPPQPLTSCDPLSPHTNSVQVLPLPLCPQTTPCSTAPLSKCPPPPFAPKRPPAATHLCPQRPAFMPTPSPGWAGGQEAGRPPTPRCLPAPLGALHGGRGGGGCSEGRAGRGVGGGPAAAAAAAGVGWGGGDVARPGSGARLLPGRWGGIKAAMHEAGAPGWGGVLAFLFAMEDVCIARQLACFAVASRLHCLRHMTCASRCITAVLRLDLLWRYKTLASYYITCAFHLHLICILSPSVCSAKHNACAIFASYLHCIT